MIRIHELPADPGRGQKRHRVGRGEGSGWGRCAGKGNKGQQARSGSGKGAAFEGGQMPLIRRIPKFGFSNTRFRPRRAHVTLRQLQGFASGSAVDLEALLNARLIQKKAQYVKIIGSGEFKPKLSVKAHGFSAGARAAIEAAGGACETLSL